MYVSYWGLREKPFENTPDPKFLYESQQHREALARLLYVVHERKGAVLLTGDYGSGKTLLTRVLWQELQQEHIYQPAFILNPRLSGIEFIQEIVAQLSGGESPANKIDLFHALHKMLYANFNASRHTVIIVDEAQAIKDPDIFEELRLLLNFQKDSAFLLTIVLIGQPELLAAVRQLPQLTQRFAAKFHLKALDEAETRAYVTHRLQVAGAATPVFTDAAYQRIFQYTHGVPRNINNVCDLALLVGFGAGMPSLDERVIDEVGRDLELDVLPSQVSDGTQRPS